MQSLRGLVHTAGVFFYNFYRHVAPPSFSKTLNPPYRLFRYVCPVQRTKELAFCPVLHRIINAIKKCYYREHDVFNRKFVLWLISIQLQGELFERAVPTAPGFCLKPTNTNNAFKLLTKNENIKAITN
jgi:hypothetical protein